MKSPWKCHAVLVLIAGILAISQEISSADETSFLDRPVPPEVLSLIQPVSSPDPNQPGKQAESPMLTAPSLAGTIDILQKLSGKKMILDKDLQTWPEENQEKVWGISTSLEKDAKVRAIFERLCMFAGLDWKYDPTSDTIFVAPQWKREDTRSEKELIQVVGQTKPLQSDKLPVSTTPNRVGGHSPALDDWRIAFDALLSKPMNYSSAGTLRVYHDSHGHINICPFPVQNVFAGVIQDEHGKKSILVLNEQLSMSNKDDAGDLAYYLFDENGKFLNGGVYAVADGAQSGIVKMTLESNQSITMDVGYGSFKMGVDHLHLGLVDGDLILLGSTDRNGKERNAEETRQSLCQFSKMMRLKFRIAGH